MEPTLDEALLTAYLDGELTPQDRQRLEQRLTEEPELRQRLTLLEETWHYLDLLEQESADAEKIETTMRIAAVSVLGTPLMPPNVSRFVKWGFVLLAGIALFIVSFQVGKQSPLDDPSFCRMVERLDMYRAIVDDDGLELLQQLAVKRVFLPPLSDDVSQIDMNEYKPSFRVGILNFFAPSTIGDGSSAKLHPLFYRNKHTFDGLPPAEKSQIEKLHRDIEKTPQYPELVATLKNYYYWHKSLQSYERAELRQSKSLDEKVANIIELQNRLGKWLLDASLLTHSELVGTEENLRLAGVLTQLPYWQKEQILNNEPIQIINELKWLADQ